MRKIGVTTTKNVIVEMTDEEYVALEKLHGLALAAAGAKPVLPVDGAKMSDAERVAYAGVRLRKLAPKKKDGLIRSLQAMFQFHGGIEPAAAEKIVTALQKRKVLVVADDGSVTYPPT